MNRSLHRLIVIPFFVLIAQFAHSQFLMDMIDTTKDLGKGMLSVYHRFDRIQISGYLQPQFQVASQEGIQSFAGGNFAPNSNNRFMIRRGRLRTGIGNGRGRGRLPSTAPATAEAVATAVMSATSTRPV